MIPFSIRYILSHHTFSLYVLLLTGYFPCCAVHLYAYFLFLTYRYSHLLHYIIPVDYYMAILYFLLFFYFSFSFFSFLFSLFSFLFSFFLTRAPILIFINLLAYLLYLPPPRTGVCALTKKLVSSARDHRYHCASRTRPHNLNYDLIY